ncbi:MAG TPA: DUF4291 family protein [Ktedonobacteraceae bacterium]|jgi:hypothetical protein
MQLVTESYLSQLARWPTEGRHILAQYDEDSIIVYQAYRPAIGHFAAQRGYFGHGFSFERMSWLKPNFLFCGASYQIYSLFDPAPIISVLQHILHRATTKECTLA